MSLCGAPVRTSAVCIADKAVEEERGKRPSRASEACGHSRCDLENDRRGGREEGVGVDVDVDVVVVVWTPAVDADFCDEWYASATAVLL